MSHALHPVSKLDRRRTGRQRKRDNLLKGVHGGCGGEDKSYDRKKAWSFINLSYIYLGYFVCLCVIVCVCVCVTIAERSAILLVLAIKLIKETRRRVWRGRDRDGEIWERDRSEREGVKRLFIV
jgi:hypothetical protein